MQSGKGHRTRGFKGKEGMGWNLGSWKGQKRAQDRQKVVGIYRGHLCLLPGYGSEESCWVSFLNFAVDSPITFRKHIESGDH